MGHPVAQILRRPSQSIAPESQSGEFWEMDAFMQLTRGCNFGKRHNDVKKKLSGGRSRNATVSAPATSTDFFGQSQPEPQAEPELQEEQEDEEQEDEGGLLAEAIGEVDAAPGAMSREQATKLRK